MVYVLLKRVREAEHILFTKILLRFCQKEIDGTMNCLSNHFYTTQMNYLYPIWVYIAISQEGVDKCLAFHNQTIEILSIVPFTYNLLYLKQ